MLRNVAVALTVTACAPPTSMPPPIPAGAASGTEIGAAGMAGIWIEESCPRGASCSIQEDTTLAGQLFGKVDLLDRVAIGGSSFVGTRSQEPAGPRLAGAGAFIRYALKQSDDGYFGVQVGGGALYWQAGIPLSKRTGANTFIYAHPMVGSSYQVDAQYWPFGLTYQLDQQLRLSFELGAETHLLSKQDRDRNLFYGGIGMTATP